MLIHVFEVARLYLRELDRRMKLCHKKDVKGKKAQRQANEDEMEEERDRTRLRMLQFVLMVDVQGAGMLPNLVRWTFLPPSKRTLYLLTRGLV